MIGTIVDVTARTEAEEASKTLIVDLRKALENVKTLSGLLPVCSWCHQVRDDQGYWGQVETYLTKHTHVQVTHGMCPACKRKMTEESGWDQGTRPTPAPPTSVNIS